MAYDLCMICDSPVSNSKIVCDACATPVFNSPPWRPCADAHTIACIGKLGEEAAELAKACFRALIQGVDGIDPKTGETNRNAIASEAADVCAAQMLVNDLLAFDETAYDARVMLKLAQLRDWQGTLKCTNAP